MIKYEKEFDKKFGTFYVSGFKWQGKDGPDFGELDMKRYINKCLLRQIDEDNKRFLGMIDKLELLKRNTPNPLKMDIVHSHGELQKMRHNNMFNEAINFIVLELRDKVNKK